jgi:predicted dithiol-disulfide oxidoreductase (DUF899 family)|tara:strand:- start:63 stop:707 length:645 start_codon:yes stop_codon:yes gene_type:complete
VTNKVVSREEWLAARHELLVKEKAHTRERDRLSAARRDLPWVRVEKDYLLMSADGPMTLHEFFLDRSQLIVYHFMFGADWDAPCPGCTAWAEAFNGTTTRFKQADARLIAVSRAPIEKLTGEQEKRGWTFTWVSSCDSDFGIDFHVSSQDPDEASRAVGSEVVHFDRGENHGISVFFKNDEGELFHTYSCYNRGIESMNGALGYYDVLPKGRAW